VNLDVQVEALGDQWSGKTLDLSPYGVRVAAQGSVGTLPPGARARVRLMLGDQEAPLSLPARVVRADPDGVALDFDGPEERQFQRLKSFVDTLLKDEPSAAEPGNAHWQALLKRLGLETLQLPGELTGQWKEFLEQFEARDSARRKVRKSPGPSP
jgi:hypothetical protein